VIWPLSRPAQPPGVDRNPHGGPTGALRRGRDPGLGLERGPLALALAMALVSLPSSLSPPSRPGFGRVQTEPLAGSLDDIFIAAFPDGSFQGWWAR